MAEQIIKYVTPDSAALTKNPDALLALYSDFEIDSPEMYADAVEQVQIIKAKAEALDEQRKTITGPMDQAKKAVMDVYRGPLEKLGQVADLIKAAMLAYTRAEAEKARIAQLEAQRLANEERTRLENEAAEKAAASQAAVEQGNFAEAEALANDAQAASMSAAVTIAPRYTPTFVAPKGVSTRSNWKAELEGVTDQQKLESLTKLIAFVAANPSYINALQVNTQGLNAFAKAQKQSLAIPGVRAFDDANIAVRKAA